METTLDILTGIGLAVAAGIRPFLPGLIAGALASANFAIDFDGTSFAFLESPVWLLALVLALILAVAVQRRAGVDAVDRGPVGAAISGLAIGAGAVLFAGALADHTDFWYPGIVAGLGIAYLADRAARDLFRRTRARLDQAAKAGGGDGAAGEALVVYADGTALIVAAVAIVLPPLSLVALGLVIWLLLGARRRSGERYAGLRILR
jgi:hypothetical protein